MLNLTCHHVMALGVSWWSEIDIVAQHTSQAAEMLAAYMTGTLLMNIRSLRVLTGGVANLPRVSLMKPWEKPPQLREVLLNTVVLSRVSSCH